MTKEMSRMGNGDTQRNMEGFHQRHADMGGRGGGCGRLIGIRCEHGLYRKINGPRDEGAGSSRDNCPNGWGRNWYPNNQHSGKDREQNEYGSVSAKTLGWDATDKKEMGTHGVECGQKFWVGRKQGEGVGRRRKGTGGEGHTK